MPAVVLAALGLVAGIAAGLLVLPAPWLIAPAAAAGALLSWRRVPALAVLLSAAAAGAVHGGAARRAEAAACPSGWRDGTRVRLTVEPLDLPALGARLFRIAAPSGCEGVVRVVLPDDQRAPVRRVVTGTWRRDPGAGGAGRAERAGILLVRESREAGPVRHWRARLRLAAEQHLLALFGPRRAGLAIALTVSADLPLDPASREPYARAGLVHILSISGFHVGVLAGALVLLLRAARLGPDQARLAAVPLVCAYVWLLGFPAPALRSVLLFALWAWSRGRQRPAGTTAVIGASALGIGLADPFAVLEAGPWLSFAGAWGCLAASGWLRAVVAEQRERRARARLRLAEPVVVSAGALLATNPITIAAFGAVTPVALVANLPAVPCAAAAVPAVALALVLSLVGWHGGAAAVAAAAGLTLDGLELSARAAAAQPWAQVLVTDRLPAALLCGAVAIVLLAPRARSYRRRAGEQAFARATLATAVVLAAIGSAGMAERAIAPDGQGRLAIHFLDVGQGDAALVRTPHGQWVVVDGGPRTPAADAGRRKVVPFLRRHGATRLAVLVATHGDADHLGGLPAILDAFPSDLVLEPGEVLGRPLYREFLGAAARKAARWHPARAGERIELDGVTLRVWHPDSAWMARGEETNENSVVLTVEYGGFRALLAGDAGLPVEALREQAIGDVTVLKVGHHGSRSATGAEWLEAVRPEICVLSVGQNRYGHPNPGVVRRLRDAGCDTWRTDRAGDVTVTTDGRSVAVRSAERDTVFTVSQEQP